MCMLKYVRVNQNAFMASTLKTEFYRAQHRVELDEIKFNHVRYVPHAMFRSKQQNI